MRCALACLRCPKNCVPMRVRVGVAGVRGVRCAGGRPVVGRLHLREDPCARAPHGRALLSEAFQEGAMPHHREVRHWQILCLSNPPPEPTVWSGLGDSLLRSIARALGRVLQRTFRGIAVALQDRLLGGGIQGAAGDSRGVVGPQPSPSVAERGWKRSDMCCAVCDLAG